MYLGDRDVFVLASVVVAAALASVASGHPRPDEYFRRSRDVKASPELPPGSPYSPPQPFEDAVFGQQQSYYPPWKRREEEKEQSEMLMQQQEGERVQEAEAGRGDDDATAASINYSSHINYSYKDILRLGG
jgi:cell division protein FtsN